MRFHYPKFENYSHLYFAQAGMNLFDSNLKTKKPIFFFYYKQENTCFRSKMTREFSSTRDTFFEKNK
ncbi:hypothetical protein BpHYR1_029605 [Brachionus plicatilis]|uniref:Uncharacterized protein n=1 Tax=Brachionus plicatilis TaxID=10195 RepID=A0A3M7RPR4_BRAPC|nr:hypothetical protein BpHYR1_029605 [Brachionus plicatilis]